MTVGFGRWPERHFQLWEAETFGEVLAFPFACDTFWFDKPLARMAAQSCYGEIVVYDLATRQKIERPISDLEHGGGEAGGMTSFLATGGLFVMDSQDGPQVLDEHTLVRRRRVPMREKLSAAVTAVSPAEAFAAVWDYEMLGVYRLPSLTKERSQALPHHEPFTAWQITWLDDKRLLLASQREGQVLVASIDPAGGLRALRRDAAPRGDGAPDGSEGCAADAAFEPVTRAIAVTDSDCSVRVLDAESFAERAHITAPEPPGPAGPLLARTHFSPAGSHLTLSSANTLAVLTASGRVVARVDAAQTSEHFSPDGRFVAVPRKHTLRIVRTADGEFVDVEMFGSGAAARGVVSTARAFQGPPELEACTAHARPDGARQERPTLLADFAAGRALP